MDAASRSTAMDCSICLGSFENPHCLPCGHCFCGPPRTCLQGVTAIRGMLKCPCCPTKHKLKREDLNLIYWLQCFLTDYKRSRDQNQPPAKIGKFPLSNCAKHQQLSVKFWCVTCSQECCEECSKAEHPDHLVRSYSAEMKRRFENVSKDWEPPSMGRFDSLSKSTQTQVEESGTLALEEFRAAIDISGVINNCRDGLVKTRNALKRRLEDADSEIEASDVESLASTSGISVAIPFVTAMPVNQIKTKLIQFSTSFANLDFSAQSKGYVSACNRLNDLLFWISLTRVAAAVTACTSPAHLWKKLSLI